MMNSTLTSIQNTLLAISIAGQMNARRMNLNLDKTTTSGLVSRYVRACSWGTLTHSPPSQIEELGEPPTNQHVYGVTARIHAPDTHPAVAITTASCSPESPRPQAATQEPLVCEDNLLSATIIENCDDMRVIHGDHQVGSYNISLQYLANNFRLWLLSQLSLDSSPSQRNLRLPRNAVQKWKQNTPM